MVVAEQKVQVDRLRELGGAAEAAMSLVEVKSLLEDDAKVEIEGIAVL